MNIGLEIAFWTILVVSLIAAVGVIPLVFWLTKSLATTAVEAKEKNWQRDDLARLLRKGVLFVSVIVFTPLLPWSFMFSTIGAMADQYFRNTVNQWTDGPDLFEHLAIEEDEYNNLPLHWKQALAEIALREGDEDEALRQFVSQLDTRQIELLDLVAQRELSGSLLVFRPSDGEPVEELSYMDMMHLESTGAIDSALPLNHKSINTVTDTKSDGDTTDSLWLVGHQYGIHLRAVTTGKGTGLSFNVLTEKGKKLIDALRRPRSLFYLCSLHYHYSKRGLSAEIWSFREDEMDEFSYYPVAEITTACETLEMTTQ